MSILFNRVKCVHFSSTFFFFKIFLRLRSKKGDFLSGYLLEVVEEFAFAHPHVYGSEVKKKKLMRSFISTHRAFFGLSRFFFFFFLSTPNRNLRLYII